MNVFHGSCRGVVVVRFIEFYKLLTQKYHDIFVIVALREPKGFSMTEFFKTKCKIGAFALQKHVNRREN